MFSHIPLSAENQPKAWHHNLCSHSTSVVMLHKNRLCSLLEFWENLKIKAGSAPWDASRQLSSVLSHYYTSFIMFNQGSDSIQLIWHHDICTKTIIFCSSPLSDSPLCSRTLSAPCEQHSLKKIKKLVQGYCPTGNRWADQYCWCAW